jgi:DNA-binding transcriptional MerR regulator
MLSIGDIAHLTGVSRRMLRHWEESGLIVPASTDEYTGHRRYARTQVGRVRAIAALRSLDFGLGEIRDLLGPQLTEQRLLSLLQTREGELAAQIDDASARLREVRKRLDAIRRGHTAIMSTIELGPLPNLRLASLQATVRDESEIGDALSDLLPRLRDQLDARGIDGVEVVVTYDGTKDENSIVVTAGIPIDGEVDDTIDASGLATIDVSGGDRGVSVRFDVPPADIGDAWISLDASLDEYGVETTGVYRQILTPKGAVILQAPLTDQPGAWTTHEPHGWSAGVDSA